MMEFLEKVGKLAPLLIAAAYFLFLAATWTKYIAEMKEMRSSFDAALDTWTSSKTVEKPAD
jgi:hypothetical protein